MGVIENANRTPLDPGLMKRMMMCLEEMPAEQRGDMTGRSIGLIRFLEENLTFEFRMEALARLRKHPEYRARAMKTDHRGAPDLIHNVLIETAALQPLIERNKGPARSLHRPPPRSCRRRRRPHLLPLLRILCRADQESAHAPRLCARGRGILRLACGSRRDAARGDRERPRRRLTSSSYRRSDLRRPRSWASPPCAILFDWMVIGQITSLNPASAARGPLFGFAAQLGSRINYIGMVRGRVGYAWDRFLVYGTDGFAYGQVNSAASAAVEAGGGSVAISTSQNSSCTSWTAGGGFEYAITKNLTVKTEYLHADLGTILNQILFGVVGVNINQKTAANIASY